MDELYELAGISQSQLNNIVSEELKPLKQNMAKSFSAVTKAADERKIAMEELRRRMGR